MILPHNKGENEQFPLKTLHLSKILILIFRIFEYLFLNFILVYYIYVYNTIYIVLYIVLYICIVVPEEFSKVNIENILKIY